MNGSKKAELIEMTLLPEQRPSRRDVRDRGEGGVVYLTWPRLGGTGFRWGVLKRCSRIRQVSLAPGSESCSLQAGGDEGGWGREYTYEI